jgi:hypothetical protein
MGEMWNSNSVISWLLARSGLRPEEIHPPPGGRAPGWGVGLRLAHLSTQACMESSRRAVLDHHRPDFDIQITSEGTLRARQEKSSVH